mmetsp:Transcript_8928/g.22941  ORF Transcript_8928/g.22941 Transcript_8928/m.22941 type:complete len:256 (-) Transcript_8928:27-794(-)
MSSSPSTSAPSPHPRFVRIAVLGDEGAGKSWVVRHVLAHADAHHAAAWDPGSASGTRKRLVRMLEDGKTLPGCNISVASVEDESGATLLLQEFWEVRGDGTDVGETHPHRVRRAILSGVNGCDGSGLGWDGAVVVTAPWQNSPAPFIEDIEKAASGTKSVPILVVVNRCTSGRMFSPPEGRARDLVCSPGAMSACSEEDGTAVFEVFAFEKKGITDPSQKESLQRFNYLVEATNKYAREYAMHTSTNNTNNFARL